MDDDEGIQQVEANSWNNEQIHGGNIRRVVAQKRAPSLTWRPTSLDHVFGDARLRDLKPELEQFAMDTWRSPKRISCSSAGSTHAGPYQSEVALPVREISNASNGEIRPDANARASRVG